MSDDDNDDLPFPKAWHQSTNIRWAMMLFLPMIRGIFDLVKGHEWSSDMIADIGVGAFCIAVGVVWIVKRVKAGIHGMPASPIVTPPVVTSLIAAGVRLTGDIKGHK